MTEDTSDNPDRLKELMLSVDSALEKVRGPFEDAIARLHLILGSAEWQKTESFLSQWRDWLDEMVPAVQAIRRAMPPNWPEDFDVGPILEVIEHDGIPLVWVPRASLVDEVVEAPNREARIGILLTNADLVSEDCRAVLADVHAEDLSGQVLLARQAVEAFAAGHHEAAQALAVVVTETAVAIVLGSNYERVRKQVQLSLDSPVRDIRGWASLAPIEAFYTSRSRSRRPGKERPAPEKLSRHVSVHEADPGHYGAGNAVVAVMLVASVLRGLQEWTSQRAER